MSKAGLLVPEKRPRARSWTYEIADALAMTTTASARPRDRLILSDTRAAAAAARELADGAVVAHAFANFYVITTRADAATVRGVNVMKGRPPGQVGSITTTPPRIPLVYDWDRLPAGLTRRAVLGIMDALWGIGPFGFRGPAAASVPDHLAQDDQGIRTAQVIAPGYACTSNQFLADALAACGDDLLYITSCNRSRHLSGAEDEPAHYRAAGIRADFGHEPRFLVLEHDDEAAARRRYPRHAPMSTTLLAFHKLAPPSAEGRPTLIVERHGSLAVDEVRRVVRPLGFDVALGPRATKRLTLRRYGEAGRRPGADA
jgi:hypothetical protein